MPREPSPPCAGAGSSKPPWTIIEIIVFENTRHETTSMEIWSVKYQIWVVTMTDND
jgi:hypothetical protein